MRLLYCKSELSALIYFSLRYLTNIGLQQVRAPRIRGTVSPVTLATREHSGSGRRAGFFQGMTMARALEKALIWALARRAMRRAVARAGSEVAPCLCSQQCRMTRETSKNSFANSSTAINFAAALSQECEVQQVPCVQPGCAGAVL